MKNKIKFLWGLGLAFLVTCHPSLVTLQAQVVGFGSTQTLTGTTNSPAVDTNSASIPVRKIMLNLSGNSGTVVTGFVGQVWLTQTPANPTNGQLVGTFTATNFTSTNVTFTAYYTNAPVYTVLQAVTGTNNVGAQEIYGP
jgi:hypothetical protein